MILEFYYLEFEDVKPVFITIIILSSQLRFILQKYSYKACSKTFIIRFFSFVLLHTVKWEVSILISFKFVTSPSRHSWWKNDYDL
jgi:hypothetical protein